MNRVELVQALHDRGVSSRYFRIGGLGNGFSNDSFLLEECKGEFRVMYIERGQLSLLASFASEDDACAFSWHT